MLRLNNAYRTPDFSNCDPNEEFTCPYDPNHKIRAKRYPYHLRVCQKNHPFSNTVSCPFNARHVVPGPEYKYHLTTCPDKRVIEQDIEYEHQKQNGEESTFKGCTDVPAYNTYQPPCSEDWDEEIANDRNFDYNPPDNFAPDIFRSTCGMTPAEKRTHREYLARQELRRKAGLPTEPERFGVDSVPDLIPPSGQAPLRLPREPAKAYQQVNQNQMVIGGQNSRLGLIGLGRGLLMNKQIGMVNQMKEDDAMKAARTISPTSQGFGRGMAANFETSANHSNGFADASEALTYVRMVGRGRGGTPQNRNRKPVPPVGGLASQTTPSSDSITIPQSPSKHEEKLEKVYKASSVDSSSSLEESEDSIRKKLLRKLTKKLNGIKILEMSKEEGKALTEEEELKITKRKEIEKQIAVLGQLT